MTSFFGDLSQSEKLSEIWPPLSLHFAKIENKNFFHSLFSHKYFLPRHILCRERKSNVFRLAIKVNFQNFFHPGPTLPTFLRDIFPYEILFTFNAKKEEKIRGILIIYEPFLKQYWLFGSTH